jgi:phosphatidylglycerophosphatase A
MTSRGFVTEEGGGLPLWIATCAKVGYFPIAPGTAGSVVGLGLVAALRYLPLGVRAGWLAALLVALASGLFALGVWAAGKAEKFFGRVDPGQVVIDEVVGQIIVFVGQPLAPWEWLLAGFLLFRFFDVIKPFPAGRAEHLPGGWGIMLDDVIAGVYSLLGLRLLELAFI